MSLKEYARKRDFDHTPEPAPKESAGHRKQIFVVQEHDARSLHFDFRLEVNGVLKSWAVPKGPSMNPEDKRLAIETEDHPLSYAHFEGTIPEGEYGAGTVRIWDHGTWEPDREHRNVEQSLEKGVLDFFLHGRKLDGEFILIRTDYPDVKNSWMLQKKKDDEVVTKAYDARKIPAEA